MTIANDIHIIDNPHDSMVVEIRRIYAVSIPAAERKPESWIDEAVERDDFRVLALTCGHCVTGFATLFVPSVPADASLLEYMATAPAHRGHGLGAELFRAAIRHSPGRVMLIEVDADREPSPLQSERRRRIAFYRRLGCRRIAGLDYILPLDTTPPPPAMDLMIGNPPATPLDRARLRNLIETIYQHVYDQEPRDPRIERMLATVVEPIGVE